MSYRQAKRNCQEWFSTYSGTSIDWDKSNQSYSIEVGSDAHKKILHRDRVRLISDQNTDKYLNGLSVFRKLERRISHWITLAPQQPTVKNGLVRPLSEIEIQHNTREIFDWFVKHNNGMNVMMIVGMEMNLSNADITYPGYHTHILIIADHCTESWWKQKKFIRETTESNYREYYGSPTVLTKEFDYNYRITQNWTALDYIHKDTNENGIHLPINYILIK